MSVFLFSESEFVFLCVFDASFYTLRLYGQTVAAIASSVAVKSFE